MARINAAYQVLAEHLLPTSSEAERTEGGKADSSRADRNRRLSKEAVDAIVSGIGTESPVDWVLGTVGWVGNWIEGVFAILFAIAFPLRIAVLVWRHDWNAIIRDPDMWFVVAVLVFFVGRELWVRRAAVEASSEGGG